MSRFTALDLSQLAPPKLIETIDFEAILAEQKAWVLARWEQVRQVRPDLPAIDTLGLETEPITLILESLSYRETLLRALVNDKARAVLLAYAVGTDLDHIGALYGVARMVDVGGNVESHDRLRHRIQLAPDAFSVAGPAGAYEFHALTSTLAIADAHAFSPADGRVTVALAGNDGALVDTAVVDQVVGRYDREDLVPLTDQVSVVRAERRFYDVEATLVIQRGPDPDLIKASAIAALRAYAATRYRIKCDVYSVGISAALKVGSVDNVVMTMQDVICSDSQIAVLRDISITVAIV